MYFLGSLDVLNPTHCSEENLALFYSLSRWSGQRTRKEGSLLFPVCYCDFLLSASSDLVDVAELTRRVSDHAVRLACSPQFWGGEGVDPGRGGAVAQDGLQVHPRGRAARPGRLPLWLLGSGSVGEDAARLDRDITAAKRKPFRATVKRKTREPWGFTVLCRSRSPCA